MEGKNRIIDEKITHNKLTKMKNLTQLLILIFCVLSQRAYTQEKQLTDVPEIDKRVELLSIVFRFAGNEEYNSAKFKIYTDRIESHFNKYKQHEAIEFAKELKEKKGISYDAVVSMAVILDENLNPLIDFSSTLPEIRWSKADANKFIRLLKKFYKETECEEFFKENEEFFKEIANRFSPVYKTLDLNWFQSFYGMKADENFTIIISPGCGDHSYGPSYTLPNAKKEVFAVLGTWKVDESGMPVYEKNNYLPTILHEFNHSFVNQQLAKHMEAFEESGKEIYKAVEYEMSRQQAYGNWQIMLNEALVRASVIKYFIDHSATESEIQMMMTNESNNGFIWIKDLVDELKKYDSQRSIYPTLESYMPVLANAYITFAEKISQYDAQRPRVESITEFANNDTSVSPQIKTITINFDRPLAGKGYSINYGSKGKPAFPQTGNISYTNDNKSVVMEVQLIPDKEYQFVLTGKNFKTALGIGLKTYEVNFRTSPKTKD
jgi:hypothetical protein